MKTRILTFLMLVNYFMFYAQTLHTKNYDNGNLREEGQLDENGKQIGEWKYYYEDGKLERVEKIEGDKIYSKSYWQNGQLSELSNYSTDGRFFGEMIMYYDNGNLWSVKKFNDGQADGKWEDFFLNGKLHSEEFYKNGNRIGTSKLYHENGEISNITKYKDGNAVESKWYLDNGKLWKTETSNFVTNENVITSVTEWSYHLNGKIENITSYTNGQPKGEWKYFDENGKLLKTEKY